MKRKLKFWQIFVANSSNFKVSTEKNLEPISEINILLQPDPRCIFE